MSNEELAVAYQGGDQDALPALWTQVEKLAVRMVRPYLGLAYRNGAVDWDDLMQAAFLAVERAASAFREGEGSFASVMGYRVKTEVHALLGLRGRVRREHYEAVSASTPLGEDGAATVGDMIPDDSLPDVDGNLLRDDVSREVHAAIDRLSVAQAGVIRGHYLEGTTLTALAAQMNVALSRAGQIKSTGMRKMRADWRLRQLAGDVLCYRHKGLAAFRRDWTSTVERAVIERERLREEAVAMGVSEAAMRRWRL